MAPTTRSSHGRLSSGSKGSSPQVQAGPSRGGPPYGTSQRTASAAVRSSAGPVSSDEDDDDGEEEEEEDDDDDDEEESDDESGDDDDDEEEEEEDDDDVSSDEDEDDSEPDMRTRLEMIFASFEPNGLGMDEPRWGQVRSVSNKYRDLTTAVIDQALQNTQFRNTIQGLLTAPSDGHCNFVYERLKVRFDLAKTRSHYNMMDETEYHMCGLINTIRRMTKVASWPNKNSGLRRGYFDLLSRILRYIVDHDVVASRPGSGSGGSSPFTGDPNMNHNLFRMMIRREEWARAGRSLDRIYRHLNGPVPPRDAESLRQLLRDVMSKSGTTETPTPQGSLTPSQVFNAYLHAVCSGKFHFHTC